MVTRRTRGGQISSRSRKECEIQGDEDYWDGEKKENWFPLQSGIWNVRKGRDGRSSIPREALYTQ